MNERIKELALQARNYALDEKRIYERMHNTEQCMEEYREVYNEKFAELIVGEFYETIKKDMELAHIQLIPIDFGIYANGRLRRIIKEHFGVEE
jgi:hypothetical protein